MAIGAVVLFHTAPFASGGYIGVEIFFALSGYLITALLLDELDKSGRIDRKAFYTRRVLRLVPALAALIVLSTFLAWMSGSNNGGLAIGQAVPPVLLYYGNWVEAAGLSLGFLSHCWSLAIEEQFYLIWPLVIVAIVKRRDVLVVLAAAAMALVVFRAALTPIAPSAENLALWTTSKADCVLIGAIVAVLFSRERRLVRLAIPSWVGWGAFASLLFIFVFLSVVPSPIRWSDYGGTTLVGLATAVLIAHVLAAPNSAVATLLRHGPIAGVGRVSYGIYLYHWPIVAWVGLHAWSTSTRMVVEYTLTAIAVCLSWLLIERPALRLKRRFARFPARLPTRTDMEYDSASPT